MYVDGINMTGLALFRRVGAFTVPSWEHEQRAVAGHTKHDASRHGPPRLRVVLVVRQ